MHGSCQAVSEMSLELCWATAIEGEGGNGRGKLELHLAMFSFTLACSCVASEHSTGNGGCFRGMRCWGCLCVCVCASLCVRVCACVRVYCSVLGQQQPPSYSAYKSIKNIQQQQQPRVELRQVNLQLRLLRLSFINSFSTF